MSSYYFEMSQNHTFSSWIRVKLFMSRLSVLSEFELRFRWITYSYLLNTKVEGWIGDQTVTL